MNANGKQWTQNEKHVNSDSGLLSLPPDLRDQIYTASEVIGWDGCAFIDLSRHTCYDQDAYYQNNSYASTLALLLTCQTIYEELATRVYGRNHIFIRCRKWMNLCPLRQLSMRSIRALTKLTVHLNVASCGLGDICHDVLYWSSDAEPEYDQKNKPLSKDDDADQSALEDWRLAWTEIIRPQLLQPARLELHFVCDVADFETGLVAVQPLLTAESHASLAQCSIRLGRRVDLQLRNLAEKTARHITSSNVAQDTLSTEITQSPLRFFELPIELQRHILTFTDLVTPFREVEWSRSKGMRFRHKLPKYLENIAPYMLHGCSVKDLIAGRFEGSLEQFEGSGCWQHAYPTGCYCRTFHSAFSNVYQCRCWAPPTALFLVSKSFRHLAMETFFGSNRFIVTPYGGRTHIKFTGGSPSRLLHTSIFFKNFAPKDALPHLRFVELVFPPFGEGGPFDYCPPNGTTWQDWVQTLDYIRDQLTLPSLTIRICFASWVPRNNPNQFGPFTPLHRMWMNDEHYPNWLRRQKKSIMDVILPMKRLRGLRAFFAILLVPSPCTQNPYQGGVIRLADLEEEAERVVMGYEYNASLAGKELVQESTWSEVHDCVAPLWLCLTGQP